MAPAQEDPYIMLDQPTACTNTKGSICQMVPDSALGRDTTNYDSMDTSCSISSP